MRPELWDGSVGGYFRWWRNKANRQYAFRSAWANTRRLFSWRFLGVSILLNQAVFWMLWWLG
jgi:hypothetical protein